MTKIDKPGIYDITLADYINEPCAEPSISSTGLRQILDCPAKYWWNSPLNPDRPVVDKRDFSIGHACHDLILQGDRFFEFNVVLPEDKPLTTKAGKEIRDAVLAEGRNYIRFDDWQKVKAMHKALLAHDFAPNAFINGQAERTLVCRDEETGVLLRVRPDFLPTALQHIPDYKTAATARPVDFARQVEKLGYHMQAALYLDAIEAVTGHKPDSFFFVVQEKEPPYVVTCPVLDNIAIEWGRIENRKAVHTFARCLEADHWPGYESDVIQISLPVYAERELQRQLEHGRFETGEAA